MTPTVRATAKEAIGLVREGFSPEDAIDMACKNTRLGYGDGTHRSLSAVEREHVAELVYEEDPR
jgi:hypothetical protein